MTCASATRQGGSETVVDAASEPEVLVVRPLGIEAIRIREPRWIAVARRQREGDEDAFGNGRPRDGDLLERRPVRQEVNRRLVPKKLLHRADDEIGLAPEPLENVRVTQERQHSVRDEIDRRLVPGDEQEHGGRDQDPVVHATPGLRVACHAREHVATRSSSTPRVGGPAPSRP